MITDGGIRMPSVPPAAIDPAAKESACLKRRISGIDTRAIVAAVASDDPQIAPKPAQAAMVDMERPPRQWPMKA